MRALILVFLFFAGAPGCKTRHDNADALRDRSAKSAAYTLSQLMAEPKIPGLFQFIPVPLIRQARDYTCAAASMESVLAYLGVRPKGGDPLWEGPLASKYNLNSDPELGTRASKMVELINRLNDAREYHKIFKAAAADESGGDVAPSVPDNPDELLRDHDQGIYETILYDGQRAETRMSEADLRRELDRGRPVIINLQAWATSNAPGDYRNDSDSGHYAVAVGYDARGAEVIYFFMDPWTHGKYTFIPAGEFSDRWHDKDQDGIDLNHFGLVVVKKVRVDGVVREYEPLFSADTVVKME